jgi:hypothetical protein
LKPARTNAPAFLRTGRLFDQNTAESAEFAGNRSPGTVTANAGGLLRSAAFRVCDVRDPRRILRLPTGRPFFIEAPRSVPTVLDHTLVNVNERRYSDRKIATEADVDLILTGTLLRAGGEVRVSAQLTDAASGTLLWSDTAQAPVGDVFRVQDDLAQRIVSSLSLPLTARQQRMNSTTCRRTRAPTSSSCEAIS